MAAGAIAAGWGYNDAPLGYRHVGRAAEVIDLKQQSVNLGHVEAREGVGEGSEGDFVVAGAVEAVLSAADAVANSVSIVQADLPSQIGTGVNGQFHVEGVSHLRQVQVEAAAKRPAIVNHRDFRPGRVGAAFAGDSQGIVARANGEACE